MIPILYSASETEYTNNGLGRLTDAISCDVTEERNGQFELEMLYPSDGIHFTEIQKFTQIYAESADGKGPQPFRVYYISKPINGQSTIKAEHISYILSEIPVKPFTAGSVVAALNGLSQNAAITCPFTFWTDKTSTAHFEVKVPASIRSRLGGTEESILDVYGGEYEFDHRIVKLHNARGQDKGVILRYGKNITDIRQEENITSTYTGILPYWRGDDGYGNEDCVTLDTPIYAQNAGNFPYQRIEVVDLTTEFDGKPNQSELRAEGQTYLNKNKYGVPDINISVSFVALWQTEEYKNIANLERVNLCDTVTVEFPKLDISASAKVVKTVYDVLSERYKSIELGDIKSNFAKSISMDIKSSTDSAFAIFPTKSFLQRAIDHATSMITGGLGGHVVMTLNADDEPEEILIMDTDDIQTAVNVIRMNKNGIGFSSNGYAGPFRSAWTIDGHFVADFIDTGNLNANLITTGVLKAFNNNFVLDLSTGQMTMKKGTINLGNGNFQVTDGGAITMKQGSINIADKFIVTSGGVLTAKGATLEGSVTSKDSNGNTTTMTAGRINFSYSNSSARGRILYQSTGITEYRGIQIDSNDNIVFAIPTDGDVVIATNRNGSHAAKYYIVQSYANNANGVKYITFYDSAYLEFEAETGTTVIVRFTESDEKLKKNIKDSTVDALSMINAIKHKSFDFKDHEEHHDNGYIAQQLETISKEFVSDVKQGDGSILKQVNTFELLSYATKAIQELSAKVDVLENRIAELEAKGVVT